MNVVNVKNRLESIPTAVVHDTPCTGRREVIPTQHIGAPMASSTTVVIADCAARQREAERRRCLGVHLQMCQKHLLMHERQLQLSRLALVAATMTTIMTAGLLGDTLSVQTGLWLPSLGLIHSLLTRWQAQEADLPGYSASNTQ